MLDSGTEGPGFKLQLQCCRVGCRQAVHINRKGCEGNCGPGGK